jgi:very-short-patch-repair endonuclease
MTVLPLAKGEAMHASLPRYARRQLGLFTRQQAYAAAYTERQIERLVIANQWAEAAPGVFRALPAGPVGFQERALALALSVDGVAFGRTALALYGLLRNPDAPEVLVARADRNRLRAGVHSTRVLPRFDIATVQSVPATLPARSICDAASALPLEAVRSVVDAAVVRKLTRPAGLARRALELRNSKRPGCGKVLIALSEQHPQLDRARNEWEALAIRLARERGLPDPIPNHRVVVHGQPRSLDLAWPAPLVSFEFDGFLVHSVRSTFDDDRARQNALVAAGWQVFRATSRMLERDPDQVFDQIAAAIGARGHENRHIRRDS